MSFFAELKKRNVYRVAAFYVIVSWLVLQAADVFTSFLPLPEWTGRLIFLLLVIGFPVSLVLAWAFELTPEGLRRDTDGETDRQDDTGRRKKRNFPIYVAVIAILAYIGYSHDWRGGSETVSPDEIRSIVVLPLDNLMNDPEQGYFVAGMHEALITELSKIKALRII